MKILAKFINYEGCEWKTMALPHFMQEIQFAKMRRMSLTPPTEADAMLATERRRFRFHDREGKYHIYKEV